MRARVCAPMCGRSRRGFRVKAAASLRVAFGCRSEACDSGSFDCGGLGMGRMGSTHGNGSGDIFIAFSTANRDADGGNSASSTGPATITRLASGALDPLFLATVQATEEAIINALVAAETMTGADYWRYFAIPHDQLQAVLRSHGRLVERK